MTAKSTSETVWDGDLAHGSGRVWGHSGALKEAPVSWAARTERTAGKTSPEELLAAALGSCYAMAFSSTLAKLGKPPKQLRILATATFDKVGDGFSVTTIDLEVHGSVPGIDPAAFAEAAKTASTSCPISRTLKGNVEIRVSPHLE